MSAPLNETIAKVTARINERSVARRARYLDLIESRRSPDPARLRPDRAGRGRAVTATS